MLRDFNLEWAEARRIIWAQDFQTWALTAPSAGATDTGGAVGAGAGAPVMSEVSTFGFTAVPMTDADTVTTPIDIYDVDITKQIRFRVLWTQTAATATDAATFIVLYTPVQLTDNVAAVVDPAGTTLIDPATALSTAITALDLSSGVAYKPQATSFGVINRNTLADTTSFMLVSVELDAVTTFSADEVLFLGLEMRYTPRRTAGPRRNILGGRRFNVLRPLGVQLATGQEGL